MRVSHVLPRAITEASGPTYTVSALCESLLSQGVSAAFISLGESPLLKGSRINIHYPRPRSSLAWRLGWSREMRDALASPNHLADVFHGHSLWMLPNIYVADAAQSHDAPLVLSPRGTLSAWALRRSRWRKRAIWMLGQRRAFRATDCAVATCTEERDDVRRFGFAGPVAVIPNGVDIPELGARQLAGSSARRLAFLSRIHPTKAVNELLDAWDKIRGQHPEWTLQIAGPIDSNYAREIQRRASNEARVEVLGPLFGGAKTEFLRSSDLFILPSHSENFGMVVAEALAAGTPVIASTGTPWAGLETHGCGWWTKNDIPSLTEALRVAMSTDRTTLSQMGHAGRRWMARDFSWSTIALHHRQLYEWLLGGNRPTEFEVDGDLLPRRRR